MWTALLLVALAGVGDSETSGDVRLNHCCRPELRFVIDESFDRMDETRQLLDRDDVRRDLDED